MSHTWRVVSPIISFVFMIILRCMYMFIVYHITVLFNCSSLTILNRQSRQNGTNWPILCWRAVKHQSINKYLIYSIILYFVHKHWNNINKTVYIYINNWYPCNKLSHVNWTSEQLNAHILFTVCQRSIDTIDVHLSCEHGSISVTAHQHFLCQERSNKTVEACFKRFVAKYLYADNPILCCCKNGTSHNINHWSQCMVELQ